jgi:hypothetical protein
MKKLFHFDLHDGLRTPRMDDIPHRLDREPWSLCVQRIENVTFGGNLTTFEDEIISLLSRTLDFGGVGHAVQRSKNEGSCKSRR